MVFKKGRADSVGPPNKSDPGPAYVLDNVALDSHVTIKPANHNSIAAQLGEIRTRNLDAFRAFQDDSAGAVEHPVGAKQWFSRLKEQTEPHSGRRARE